MLGNHFFWWSSIELICRMPMRKRDYWGKADVGEGLIVEGTMSSIDGIDILEKLMKQDSLGVAAQINDSCFIRD